MSAKHSPSVRQPVSCEPCRKRKIKCSRTRAPCDSCRRRNVQDQCFYIAKRGEDHSARSNKSNEDLLSRITHLESLLRRQTSPQTSELEYPDSPNIISPPLPPPPPPRDIGQMHQLSPESLMSDELSTPVFSAEHPSSYGLGTLTSTRDGNIRYEPKSSQWTSVLANTSLSISTPSMVVETEESALTTDFPFSLGPVPSLDELLSILPPTQQCDYLKNRYFSVFSPLFHILHDPSFQAQYAQFVEYPASTPVSWLAILFVVLSLAVTALEEEDPVLRDIARGHDGSNNIKLLSKRYRDAAMKCLSRQGVFWGRHNIQSLQALIMLIYAMGHSQEPTWILLGMTHNVAIALACHIDPSKFNLDPILSEERRRCWAGLMMLYTIQNTIQGNPDPSRRIKYDVQLPADVDDDNITLHGIQANRPGPTQMSYLIFKFRLYDLATDICQETFKDSEPSRHVIQAMDDEICRAQETWDKRYLADSTIEALPTQHAVHLHILHGYSHQLFLLLHRPFFARSILGLDVPNESQIRCIASAEALLDIHKLLSETPTFRPYKWYTYGLGSFHAFHAAAVLAVALLMPIYKPQYQKFKKVLGETLVRFDAIARRSKICEKSAKILRFLLATPSPNQTSSLSYLLTPVESTPAKNDQMRMFIERLQPQEWLGPSSMEWAEWDNLMTYTNEVVA